MSERKVYREHYRLHLDGIDTAKYAVTGADSTIALDITSNGFYAFRRGTGRQHDIHINIANKLKGQKSGDIQTTLQIEDYIDIINKQIDMRGVSETHPVSNTLLVSLAERQSKAFVPDISGVDFQFDGMVGINGSPLITPDTVYLYGSRQSLDKIDHIAAEPKNLKHIRFSSRHRVRLEPVWEQYPDLRASVKEIEIFVPVDPFTEKSVTVPVTVSTDAQSAASGIKRIELYPANVTVNCLVPRNKYAEISTGDFIVTAKIDSDSDTFIQPVVKQFPACARIKSISPQQVQYIIIK